MSNLNDALARSRTAAHEIQGALAESQRLAAEAYEKREATQRRTADATAATSEFLEEVVQALNASLEVARNAKADADRAQRLSTGIAIASLAVAIASLAIAVVALVVTGTL